MTTPPSPSGSSGPYASLEGLGLKWERTATTAGDGHVVRLVWTLPAPCAVRASFGREVLKHKLIKLFKKEIQVGDPHFDDAVYISTDTPDATNAFLESPRVREIIASMVGAGGAIGIEGATVTFESTGPNAAAAEPDAQSIGLFLVSLLAFRHEG